MTFIAGKLFTEDGQMQVLTGAVPSDAQKIDGWSVAQTGEPYVEDIGSSPVPSTAVFTGGLGIAFNQDGAMYVTTDAPSNTVLLNAMAIRQDGALHATSSAVESTDVLIGGWAISQDGIARMTVGAILSPGSITVSGTDVTFPSASSQSLVGGSYGVEFGVGAYTWNEHVTGAASSQTITIDFNSYAIAANATVQARLYYNIVDTFPTDDPANRVYTSLPAYVQSASVSGTPTEGQTLTGDNGYIIGTAPLTVGQLWLECTNNSDVGTCSAIGGATSTTYVLQSGQVGKYVRYQKTASNADASVAATSATAAVVAADVIPLAFDNVAYAKSAGATSVDISIAPVGTATRVFAMGFIAYAELYSATYDPGGANIAMDLVNTQLLADNRHLAIWSCIVEFSTTKTIRITSDTDTSPAGYAVTFTGGNASAATRGNGAKAGGDTYNGLPTLTITDSADGDIALSLMVAAGAAPIAATAGTRRSSQDYGSGSVYTACITNPATSANVTVSGNDGTGSSEWWAIACSVKG